MAVRNVVTRTGRSFRGRFASTKMGRPVAFESLLEQDAIYHFEFCSEVVAYREQPELVEFWVEGKRQVYFPDFELVTREGEIVHTEIKPKAKLNNPKLKKRLNDIAEHYRCRGMRFLVLTEDQIRNKTVLDNLKQLAYHCRWRQGDPELSVATEALSILPAQTVEGASAVLGGMRDVYRLLAAGIYVCDLTQPITGATKIWKLNGENSHATFPL